MDKSIIYQSRTLFYRMEGAGDNTRPLTPLIPVVLLHGFAEDGTIWDNQVEHLKKNYPLIIPDLPGSGRSSPLASATSMSALADAVVALLDAEKIEQCILIGHSMGGYISLAFVEKYPDRCAGFGLFHSTAYPDTEEKKANRKKSMAFIRKHGAAEFIRQSTPNLFADRSREQHPEWITAITERYGSFDPDTLIHYYQAMIDRSDRTAVLAQSRLPILFIIGRHDNTIPFETSLQQSHLPSLALIHILSASGHMGMIEAADRSNEILDEFLSFLRTASFIRPDTKSLKHTL